MRAEAERETRLFLFLTPVQHKFVALKPGDHFPGIIWVVAIRSAHRFTGVVLAHRRCLLGTEGKTKPERLTLSSPFSLQPYVHALNYLTIIQITNQSGARGNPSTEVEISAMLVSDFGRDPWTAGDTKGRVNIGQAPQITCTTCTSYTTSCVSSSCILWQWPQSGTPALSGSTSLA
jgi:hypothetical protein